MKISERKLDISKSGFQSTKQFTIGDSAKVFELMATKLYTEPEKAIIREYSANALDSHIKVKNTDPFEVHIPTYNSPFFVVRDFGEGISPEKIDSVFSVLFESDKDHTNKAVGCFGIGSLAGMSITDKFTIESWYKGRKYTYCVYLNENRIPEISTTNKDGEESTEPAGCRVTIAVKSTHFHEFSRSAAEVFRFFPIQPKCNIKTTEQKVLFKNDKYEIHEGYTGFYAVMGGIIYPIDTEFLPHAITGCKVYLKFEIGELSVKTSREALVYDDKTKKKVNEAYKSCLSLVKEEVNNSTEGLKGWSLYCKQNENYGKFPWLDLDRIEIKTLYNKRKENGDYEYKQYDTWYVSSHTLTYHSYIIPSYKIRIFEKDTEKGFFKALKNLENNGVTCLVINKTKEVMDLLGLEDSQIEKLSSLIVKNPTLSRPKVYRPACEIYKKKYKNDQFYTVQVDFKDIQYYVIRENNSVVYKDKVVDFTQLEKMLQAINKYKKLETNFDRYSKTTIDGKTVYAIPKSQIKNAINGKNVIELFEEVASGLLDKRTLQIISNHSGWYLSKIDEDSLKGINSKVIQKVVTERKKERDEYESLSPVYYCFAFLNPIQLPKPEETLLQKLIKQFPFEFIYIPKYPTPDPQRLSKLSKFIDDLNLSI